jgi:molecular chaperone DnaK
MLLLDVTPLSLGIEVAGRSDRQNHSCATRPSPRRPRSSHHAVDGQANVAIHVLQGERELAKDCRSLARFDLKGIPPMPAACRASR